MNDGGLMNIDCRGCTIDLSVQNTVIDYTTSNGVAQTFLVDGLVRGGGFIKVFANRVNFVIQNCAFVNVKSIT